MLLLNDNVITYDKDWILEYAEKTNYQRFILRTLEMELRKLQYNVLIDKQCYIRCILSKIEILEYSLKITEDTIRRYVDNIEEAEIELQHLE